ncbi:MAG: hypothetical protein GY749_30015 [Desulfobacteraceae bacterium]|nr:hypothetical protein [Desulfobacteraceae bacterium]
MKLLEQNTQDNSIEVCPDKSVSEVIQPGEELYNRLRRPEDPDESLYKRLQQSVETNKDRYKRVKEELKARKSLIERLKKAMGPIIPGLMIDLVDLITFGPIGVSGAGLVVGGVAGYWIASSFKLPIKKCLMGSMIAGAYCTLPFTGVVPVGTLIGAYVRFHEQPEDLDDSINTPDQSTNGSFHKR